MSQPFASEEPFPLLSSSFDELVRAHYGRLCNFAYRFVHSRDAAEDVVQAVFAQLWLQRDQFDVRDALPYLYQAVRNRLVTSRRAELVRERWRVSVAHEQRHAADAASEAELSELRGAVARAVGALPERCRLIFTMSREQDLSYAEIARILGISVKTVETQMGRALKALRISLADYLVVALLLVSGW
ncbi:MAG TPA: RNA polymerase sigma-70 factor [Gemmatimonadales bacterium]|jgi:RNA polymerase sigma-70 factor (ECF subfamily)|nr:RNA polymerase sigma-70 factor [Gemmatimonadales bacterium]